MLANRYSIINPTFIGFEETSSYWSVQFFSLFFIDYHLRSTFKLEQTETGQITELDQTGGPCIGAFAGFPQLKESVSHVNAQFLIFLLLYGWCYVFPFLFLLSIQHTYTVLTFDDVDAALL